MTNQVELPDDVYRELTREAEEQKVTVAEWITARLSRTPGILNSDERPLSEALEGLVGVVDSRTEPSYNPRRTTIGDLIAEGGETKHKERLELLPTLSTPLVSIWPA